MVCRSYCRCPHKRNAVAVGLQVEVAIKAFGINPVDTYIRSGNYANKPALPYTPGHDAAGVVTAVGPGASRFKVRFIVRTMWHLLR